jgi:hypothetical protein
MPCCSSTLSLTFHLVAGQLLGLTLQHEQPELEEKKSGLLRQVSG